jgi:hypothetical protein
MLETVRYSPSVQSYSRFNSIFPVGSSIYDGPSALNIWGKLPIALGGVPINRIINDLCSGLLNFNIYIKDHKTEIATPPIPIPPILDELALLEANWDGYGSSPIATAALEKARFLWPRLSAVLSHPNVVPNPNGTISFEWESDNGWANIEIGKKTFAVYVAPKNDEPISQTRCLPDDEIRLSEAIEAIRRIV